MKLSIKSTIIDIHLIAIILRIFKNYKFQDSVRILGSKIWISFMEYSEDFLFWFLLFFGKSLKNTKQNFTTSLHLL